LVEGACKTVVSKRLKQAGARAITALCCLAYDDGWDTHWLASAV